MSRPLRILLGAVAFGATVASAALPLYPELPLKYNSIPTWDSRLLAAWGGWKTRFTSNGLVTATDPDNTKQNVSEAQAYAMLLSLWMNDQAAFDKFWSATESSFWNGSCGWYGWKLPLGGGCGGNGSYAPDADIDIAGALIFASALSDKGHWTKNDKYKDKAKIILQSVWTHMVDKGNNYRLNSWYDAKGDDSKRNPSYHMPGWYPIFKEFAAANSMTGMDWDAAAKGAFDLLEAQPNSAKGMARNFSSGTGGTPGGGTNSKPAPEEMGFDAIRVPYRIGLAAMWYPKTQPRAVKYAKSVWKMKAIDANEPGMYYVAGPTLWGWGGTKPEYEQLMTRAMWGTLAASVQDSSEEAAAAFKTISTFMSANHVKPGIDYLAGANPDTEGPSAPAKNYFAQSLGLLGAIAMAGRAWNVWDDLKNPWVPEDTTTKITKALTATPSTIQLTPSGATAGTANITTVTATLSKAVSWTLTFKGVSSGAVYTQTGSTSAISFSWNTSKKGLKAFAAEVVDVRLTYPGMDSSKITGFKASVTVTPSSSILPRKATLAPYAQGGVVLTDRLWNAGERVSARVLDLSGREIQSGLTASLQASEAGVVMPLTLGRSLNVRLLEVSDLAGNQTSRYLLSPNP